MSIEVQMLMLAGLAYLAGSVPFGLLVGLAKGVDVRKVGSGNIGATNVARALGGRYFAVVFALDLLKGLVPMLLGAWVLHRQPPGEWDWHVYLLRLLIGSAAIAGHMFSLFLRFTGGKGVATSAGVALGLWPFYTIPALLCAPVFLICFFAWRIVSIGSIVAAVAFPVFYVAVGYWMGWPILRQQLPLLVFAMAVAVMIIHKHRANLARLLSGTEQRMGQ